MDLNRTKPALRTTGAITGNFGKTKVKAGSTLSDLGMTTAENIRAVPPDEYHERLLAALEITDSPRLIAFLKDEILKYDRQRGVGETRVQKPSRTDSPFRNPGS